MTTVDMAMLPEIQTNIHKISKNTIDSMPLDGQNIHKPSEVNPVNEETELESITSDIISNHNLPELKVE